MLERRNLSTVSTRTWTGFFSQLSKKMQPIQELTIKTFFRARVYSAYTNFLLNTPDTPNTHFARRNLH